MEQERATNPSEFRLTRRGLLGAAALLPLTACANREEPRPIPAKPAAPSSSAVHVPRLQALERKYDARLGVFALATGSGRHVAYRANQRFAFCSAFKGLAVAALLHERPLSYLDTVVRYSAADLLPNATITPQHVDTGMTIRALCDAAVRYSDGTAGNLLLRELGGPRKLTKYARSLGDRVTRMDRTEPLITEATPGDPRDTTSPRALATDYHEIVAGNALPPPKRAFLRGLMERNATESGAERIRAGVPDNWTVADKTGTGRYATMVDVAVAWPPRGAPIVISMMARKDSAGAEHDSALIADATRLVVKAITS